MLSRALTIIGASVVAAGSLGGFAPAATPPLPKSSVGHKVTRVATGLQVPTSFAFGAGKVFVGDGGSQTGSTPGGVFVLEHGMARRLFGSPSVVFGVVWHNSTLYVSAKSKLLAWSGWNGSSFSQRNVIYTGPKGFLGFTGLGFGADGRLYAGAYLGDKNDHAPSSAPYAFDVLSFNDAGKDLKVLARGLRQPYQMAFPTGSSAPFVSDLGQDLPVGINPPDYVVRAHPGDNYGFPKCNWLKKSACKGYAKPFAFLPPHASPMGLGIIGSRLYIALFTGLGQGPEVVAMPVKGGAAKPVLTRFAGPIVGLGTHDGVLYVGELSGTVYSVKP